MSAMPWVKLKSGYLRDEKIHFIIKKYGHDSMVFWTGLLTECRRGVLEMPEEVFAEVCIMDQQRLEELKKVFIKFDLVTVGNDGRLTIKNWSRYQYSDSYERVRRHRSASVTTSNASETEMKRTVTTEGEEEVEGDKEEEKIKALAPADLDMVAWERWVEYRKKIRKVIKPISIQAAMNKLAAFGKDQAAVVEQSIANGWQGLFDLKDNHRSSRRKTVEDYRSEGGPNERSSISASSKRIT